MWNRGCVYLVLASPHDSDAVAGVYLAGICGDVGLWKGSFFEVATGAMMSARQVPTRRRGNALVPPLAAIAPFYDVILVILQVQSAQSG